MNKGLLWKGLLILAMAGLAVWRVWPPKDNINLGLDLQGGIHLVLRVETDDAVRAETDKSMELLEGDAKDAGVTALAAHRTGDTTFEATGYSPEQQAEIQKIARESLPGWETSFSAGTVRFEMTAKNEHSIRDSAVDQAKQTIDNRINQFGVSEPLIAREGVDSDRIVVQLPGVDDPERVKRLIKSTAFLEFRLSDYPWTGGGASSREDVLAHYGGKLPDDIEIMPDIKRDKVTGKVVQESYYAVQKRRVVTGRDLRAASPSQNEFGEPVAQFSLSPDGAKRFGEATGANVGRALAIVLDGNVVSAPTINSRITDKGIITGNFTAEQVQDLVTTLRSGALPAGITYLEDRTVGPSLGADSIHSGLRAGLYGALLVVLCMLVVYKLAGMNSILALCLNIVLIFGALAYFGATLTLPGIAGIVLTIGMAVDASVLVFERIREELRGGKTVRGAIDAGFGNALSSIMDANITTLIAALFLFQFGSGPVKGFAVTLSIGIFGTLFCGVFVSRWLFDLLYSRRPRADHISI